MVDKYSAFWEDISFWGEIIETVPLGIERHQRFLAYTQAKKSGLSHWDARAKALSLSVEYLPMIVFEKIDHYENKNE